MKRLPTPVFAAVTMVTAQLSANDFWLAAWSLLGPSGGVPMGTEFRRDGLVVATVSHEGFSKWTRALTPPDESRTVDFTMQIAGFTTSVGVVDVLLSTPIR
jgi:hypothetical protein